MRGTVVVKGLNVLMFFPKILKTTALEYFLQVVISIWQKSPFLVYSKGHIISRLISW